MTVSGVWEGESRRTGIWQGGRNATWRAGWGLLSCARSNVGGMGVMWEKWEFYGRMVGNGSFSLQYGPLSLSLP